MAAKRHEPPAFECDRCDRYFQSESAVNQHMDALGHWDGSDYECDDCSGVFSDEEHLRDHEVVEHFYCDPCDQYFQSYNNIKIASLHKYDTGPVQS